jgi:membrane protein implicated in regulation of membrane protease activity
VGVLLSSLMQGRVREAIVGGGWLILISGALFLVFGSILGGLNLLGPYWPVLIILLGVISLAQAFFGRPFYRRGGSQQP